MKVIRIPQLVVLTLALTSTSADYFRYEDCDEMCVRAALSCTITELTTDYFPCTCHSTEEECEAVASSTTVCLAPDKSPRGGGDIWEDFLKHKTSTTTTAKPQTTTPPPTPGEGKCRVNVVAIATLTCTTFLSTLFSVILLLKRKTGPSNQYERFSSQDNPYQETVQDSPE